MQLVAPQPARRQLTKAVICSVLAAIGLAAIGLAAIGPGSLTAAALASPSSEPPAPAAGPLAQVPAGSASPAGKPSVSSWVQLTPANLGITTQPALAATGAVVTVAWPYPPGPTDLDNAIAVQSFTAKVGSKLVGLSKRLVVARSSTVGSAAAFLPEPHDELGLVFNDLSGTLLSIGSAHGGFSAPALVGAPYSGVPSAVESKGSLIVAEDSLLLHGQSASQAGVNYQQDLLGGCCGSEPSLGVDRSGRVWLAWYSDATNRSGIFLVRLNPATAAPIGKAMAVPDSATGDWNSNSRVNLVCRATCQVVYFEITQSTNANPLPHVMSWAPGGKPTQIGELAPTLLAIPSLAACYLNDGKLAAVWYDRSNGGPGAGYYGAIAGPGGPGGKAVYLGQPASATLGSYVLEAVPSGKNLVLLALDGAVSGSAAAAWVEVLG